MILYPAIDLKGGQCVRLYQGDMAKATVYNADPADQAQRFAEAGAAWLHVVDLDGAVSGQPANVAAVQAILGATGLPLQLGGGIRNMDTIDAWFDAGVSRLVLGTAAVRDPKLAEAACAKYPEQIAIGIDARNGMVATDGWGATSTIAARDLAKRAESFGAAAIIYTDIARDGTLQGPDLEGTLALAEGLSTPVIVSGGVSSLADIRILKTRGGHLGGVICGRALYDGKLDLAAALRMMQA